MIRCDDTAQVLVHHWQQDEGTGVPFEKGDDDLPGKVLGYVSRDLASGLPLPTLASFLETKASGRKEHVGDIIFVGAVCIINSIINTFLGSYGFGTLVHNEKLRSNGICSGESTKSKHSSHVARVEGFRGFEELFDSRRGGSLAAGASVVMRK